MLEGKNARLATMLELVVCSYTYFAMTGEKLFCDQKAYSSDTINGKPVIVGFDGSDGGLVVQANFYEDKAQIAIVLNL